MRDRELVAVYASLKRKAAAGTFDGQDALDWLVVVVELGKREYVLNADETEWIKPEHDSQKS